MSVAVEFRAVAKSFGPVRVLHDVSFAVEPGRVYGLLGENGAGKSTLMKILAGYEALSDGELRINGQVVQFDGPRDAEVKGIAMMHQEFNLADDLNITQNIFLGHEKKQGWLLDDQAMAGEAAALLKKVGLKTHPSTMIRQLIIAEKQLVEIAKALAREAQLLIMDEPTATLTPGETERLFGLISQLNASGVTVIYISHKLDEVERITQEVIVMRDGRFVTRTDTRSVTRQQMANLMVGRELSDLFPPRTLVAKEVTRPPLLRVQGLTVPGWAADVSFNVQPGEILGFAGLVGAGRTEMFEGLLGLRKHHAEHLEMDGRPVRFANPRAAADHGLTYLSEDRKGKGLHVDFGLRENLTLMALKRYAAPWLHPTAERRALQTAVGAFGIRTGSLDIRASSLSGGNQQKLALAKVLHPDPKVLVLDEPTRGVDVGAKRDIYFLIQKLASQGRGIVIISSELMELIGLCHRVAVLREGRLQVTLDAANLTEQDLIAYATGTH